MSTTLTKKQQKAQAFRAKQKAKAKGLPEPSDLPEADEELDLSVGDAEPTVTVASGSGGSAESGKKRKREQVAETETVNQEKSGKEEKEDGKSKGKGKEKEKKSAWDEDEQGAEPNVKKSKKDTKQRFILFVGNLSYDTTREDIQAHFKEAVGSTPQVRLLTERSKPSGSHKSAPPKSRGIAFLELNSSTELQACLRLHHSLLSGRRVNVELTAGGGGKSEARKGKIEERKFRMGGQRERKAERLVEAGGQVELGEPTEGEGEAGLEEGVKKRDERSSTGKGKREGDDGIGTKKVREENDGIPTQEGIKMRGGRRVKVKPDEGRGGARSSRRDGRGGASGRGVGHHGGGGSASWQRRDDGDRNTGSGYGRRKWEPTGANAITVG